MNGNNKNIEVEKKFLLNDEDIKRLTAGATFINEKVFTDTYYDSDKFDLTREDKWLRLRDKNFQLKLPLNNGLGSTKRKLDQYKELESEDEIRYSLDIQKNSFFEEDLLTCGYKPFCKFATTRRKYKVGDFVIDLDKMDFGYKIGEIELMVADESEMENALNRILDFAKEKSLVVAPVRGKVIEYLKRKNPGHYQELIDAGVI
jgi:predicted adenylyl cyclase CyaB